MARGAEAKVKVVLAVDLPRQDTINKLNQTPAFPKAPRLSKMTKNRTSPPPQPG